MKRSMWNAPSPMSGVVHGAAVAAIAISTLIGATPGTVRADDRDDSSSDRLVWGLTESNELISFSEQRPGTLHSRVAVTGTGDLIGIDFRPADERLYSADREGVIYTIDPQSGVATRVSQMSVRPTGGRFGFDFNPVADRLRLTGDDEQNLRINVADGATIEDGKLSYAPSDRNTGRNPMAVGAAYTNSDNDPNTGTTLFDIDSGLDILARQDPPNDGVLNTAGSLGGDTGDVLGFDIRGANDGVAALQVGGVARLFHIDLQTGMVREWGRIGGGEQIEGLALPLGNSGLLANNDDDSMCAQDSQIEDDEAGCNEDRHDPDEND